VSSKKADQLYSDEISLLTPKELEDYVLLNLRKIHNYRRNFNIPVIGIAGLEGKTTTVKMLSAILSSKHKVLETPPNCSTTYGVTSTLLKLDQSHEFAIIEVGIVEPVQFERAVQVLEPTIAAITNIGESHLATYGDKYLIADAKLEMLRRLPRDGYAVLNIDDDLVSAMAKFSGTSNVIKFGLNKNAQFYASKIEYLGPDGIIFYVNGFYPFHLPIYSSAAIYNALTAISIARILGVEFSEIKEALETRFRLLEGTGNLIKHKKNYVLDYTYDATINSVHKACESLVQFNPYSKKLILVIGDSYCFDDWGECGIHRGRH
jgi:UDP-N-acetylmuramoyl-tripeptide--D-alanyl-D-alanine ligase